MPSITCTTNSEKSLANSGSIVTVRSDNGDIVDCFVVPHSQGVAYCEKHKYSDYGIRYKAAVNAAGFLDDFINCIK